MITTKGKYTLLIMIDLAENTDGDIISLNEIAKHQGISKKYLETIVKKLVKADLIVGIGGCKGGYKLVKSPKKYTVGEIIEASGEDLSTVACLDSSKFRCAKAKSCKTLTVWKGLNKTIHDYLYSIKLSDLIK